MLQGEAGCERTGQFRAGVGAGTVEVVPQIYMCINLGERHTKVIVVTVHEFKCKGKNKTATLIGLKCVKKHLYF